MKGNNNKHPLIKAGLTAAAVLGMMHAANRMIFYFAERKSKARADRFYDWKYGRIHYTKTGSGSPVLLVHRLEAGGSLQEWSRIRQQYSEHHTVYALDLLGCGRSDKPALTYTNYLYVQLLKDFASDVIGKPCKVIASGLSCSFVIMANRMYPDLFRSFIFVQPVSISDTKKVPSCAGRMMKKLYELPILGTFLYNCQFAKNSLASTVSAEFIRQTEAAQWVEQKYIYSHISGSSSRFLQASLAANFCMIDIEKAVSELNKPVKLILGGRSGETPQLIEEYMECNTGIQIATINDTRQYPHLERPVRFLTVCENK